MNILISGFPYVRKNYLEVFEHYPKGDKLFYLLPKIWKVKGGKVIFKAPDVEGVITARAYFYHSHYPVLGGTLKGWMPIFPFVALKLKLKNKLDLVYSCSEPILLTTLYQGVFTKLFGLKHVLFSWENIDYDKKLSGFRGFFQKIIIRLNLALSDGIICGNKKGEMIIKKLTNKPISVIPMNGVNPDYFKPRGKTETFRQLDFKGLLVFSFVGAIGIRKGVHYIVMAFSEVVKRMPNSHLIIAGSGEYEDELKKEINELRIKNITNINWVGHDELLELLALTDVFLYPSLPYKGWEEQLGYSMAEASLMEKPIISTRSGSIDEVIVDGKTGILVEPDNVDELEEAMIKLGQDKELRERMGREARKYISENFSHEVVAKKFYNCFHKLEG